MAARSFSALPRSCFTPEQLQALAAKGVTESDIIGQKCIDNTCGKSVEEILQQYPRFYNERAGIYTEWGDIDLPWDEVNTLNGVWQVAEYTDSNSYVVGDEVVRIEDDGYKLVVYVATSNVPVPAGSFNPALWSEICHIVTSEPVGLPDISKLLGKYEYYNPKKYLTTWSEAGEEWNIDLNSDEWGEYKIEKQYFYRSSDIVLYDTRCGTYTCVYVATQDMPANNELIVPGPPPADYWQKLYCVKNDKEDKCEKKVTCSQPNREVVSLSPGDNDLICVPVESRVGG